MANKNTMMLIEKETHDKIKKQAAKNGMTLMGYIKVLVERDMGKGTNWAGYSFPPPSR